VLEPNMSKNDTFGKLNLKIIGQRARNIYETCLVLDYCAQYKSTESIGDTTGKNAICQHIWFLHGGLQLYNELLL